MISPLSDHDNQLEEKDVTIQNLRTLCKIDNYSNTMNVELLQFHESFKQFYCTVYWTALNDDLKLRLQT